MSGLRKEPVRGSDPEIEEVNGRWFLHYTYGPTKPGARGGSWPGIYQRVSRDVRGPYGEARIIFRADARPRSGLVGIETMSVTRVPARELWIGLVHTYEAGQTNSKLCSFTAKTLAGSFRMEPGDCVAPTLPWEEPWRTAQDTWRGMISEPGIAYDNAASRLVATYAALSNEPDGIAWRTGLMRSDDDGASWVKDEEPVLVPPKRFTDASGINTVSHGCLVAEPRKPGTFHFFANWSGRVSTDLKGIKHWFFDGESWHENPRGLLLTASETKMDHIGGPSVLLELARERWVMVYHADNRPRGIRRHLRHAEAEL